MNVQSFDLTRPGAVSSALVDARRELNEAHIELRHAEYEVAKSEAWVAYLERQK